METQAHAAIVAIQQAPPAAVMQHAGVVQRETVNVSAVRVLAIIQSIIGFLAVIFGFTLRYYERYPYYDYEYSTWSVILGIVGIVAGSVICVAGALGIISCKDPQNHCKNGLHMAFCILACCASVVGIGFFSVLVSYYDRRCQWYSDRYCATKAFVGISLFLVTTEFIVAFTAAIFTCLFACCGASGCCENSQGGVMYAGNQQYVLTSASGQPVMVPAYPPGSDRYYVSSAAFYPNQAGTSQSGGGAQVSSTMYYPNQAVATEASTAGPMQGATSVTYSSQGLPPAYQEKEQPGQAS